MQTDIILFYIGQMTNSVFDLLLYYKYDILQSYIESSKIKTSKLYKMTFKMFNIIKNNRVHMQTDIILF